MEMISVIIPCFNEMEVIPIFYKEITRVFETELTEYLYELVFIDDGSKDKTLELIKNYSETDSHIVYLSFSRNFGKEAAIYAGFRNCSGDLVVVMDADLQDPPSLLPVMVKRIADGYDSVATRRENRTGEPRIRSCFAH